MKSLTSINTSQEAREVEEMIIWCNKCKDNMKIRLFWLGVLGVQDDGIWRLTFRRYTSVPKYFRKAIDGTKITSSLVQIKYLFTI